MTRAAIYARKSTAEAGVAEDAKSITRQIAHAQAYAVARGWTVVDDVVFVDDGVSGAEFARRPGFVRLMAALRPSPPFDVLIMSEESRLGREAIETAYAIKQIISAGVRIFFYLEDRERTLDSPTDKILLSLTAFADELEREKARQRTHDALARKAALGHVTGGRVFGYTNVVVPSASGGRSHVERHVNEPEAAIVRQIFAWSAAGWGYARIAKTLNARRALSPRAQRGRPRGWSVSSIYEVLHRDLYRGVVVWNKTRKRDRWGRVKAAARTPAEWQTHEVPTLRIVDPAAWLAVQARKTVGPGGPRRRHDGDSRFLLTGLMRCAVCGSSLQALYRGTPARRYFRYGCVGYQRRGKTVCPNNAEVPVPIADRAVLDEIFQQCLADARLDAIVDAFVGRVSAVRDEDRHRAQAVRLELADTEAAIARLVDAIAAGHPFDSLLQALRAREHRRDALRLELADSERPALVAGAEDQRRLAHAARRTLEAFRAELLQADVAGARAALKRLLLAPMVFTPRAGTTWRRGYHFAGEAHVLGLFAGEARDDPHLAGTRWGRQYFPKPWISFGAARRAADSLRTET